VRGVFNARPQGCQTYRRVANQNIVFCPILATLGAQMAT